VTELSTATAAQDAVRVDLGNVQGLVARMYRQRVVRHLLFRFGGSAEARGFLRGLLPHITLADASPDPAPDPVVNVGITYHGLQALGAEPALLDELSSAFREGPDPHQLGDAAESASATENWWEGRFSTEDVHCIVHLHVSCDEALQTASALARTLAQQSGMTELIPRIDGTVLDARSLGGGKLHFGYTDGISHVDVGWDDESRTPQQVDFREFLLGYAGAAGRSDENALLRDGAYGAFRWIYQDVATFNRFLGAEGPRMFPDRAPGDAEELLAAKMMGRWRDGTPLVLSPDRPDPTMTRRNDFGYEHDDPDGLRCPFSAHIRVVNPRDQRLDPIVAKKVPAVIRRGMPYGPLLEGSEDDGVDRGLFGIFMCADIRRQLYSLTGWIKLNDFSPVYDSNRRVQDALFANRAQPGAVAQFTIPGEGGEANVMLPDFVRTKGTAFLLYPSKSTLQRLSEQAGPV
jgi:deferrochelatase/peroxidase EfeB